MKRTILGAACALVASGAMAGGLEQLSTYSSYPTYNQVTLTASVVDADANPGQADAGIYSIKGSIEVSEHIFVTGAYGYGDHDYDIDTHSGLVGIGFFDQVGESSTWHTSINATYGHAESYDADQYGAILDTGFRHYITDQFELNGGVFAAYRYSDYDESTDTSMGARAGVAFHPREFPVVVGFGLQYADDSATSASVSVGYEF